MPDWRLNRREFCELGVAGAGMALGPATLAASGSPLQEVKQVSEPDPFLQLAWRHQWVDHDPHLWPYGMRLCLQIPTSNPQKLRAMHGPGVKLQSHFQALGQTWATFWCDASSFNDWFTRVAWPNCADHLWGAPWSDTGSIDGMSKNAVSSRVLSPGAKTFSHSASPSPGKGAQRCLMIDQGFPIDLLVQEGFSFRHRSSLAIISTPSWQSTTSHAAQVLGQLRAAVSPSTFSPESPCLLYELPKALNQTIPLGALWPEVIDAICWAISDCVPGSTLTVMLSVISTDGDRHPQSFISRCASALTTHAQCRGIQLLWLMAAGNSHSDQQNLRWTIPAHHCVEWEWHLPPQNHRPSFLECWFSAPPECFSISVSPPPHSTQIMTLACDKAIRTHMASNRTQAVLRLPPSATWASSQTLARPGPWRIKVSAQKDLTLDAHLSLMASPGADVFRQSRIQDLSPAQALDIISVSGLIPWMPDVWAVQCLQLGDSQETVWQPDAHQLTPFSGRWPANISPHGLQSIGVRLDDTPLRRGVLAHTTHGHRMYRVNGTSMAVPRAWRALKSNPRAAPWSA